MNEATKIKTKQFLNPEKLLQSVPLSPGMIVADFGCGNGYYSIAAASIAGKKGEVYAIDIQEEALSQTSTLAKLTRAQNVYTRLCDLEKFASCPLADTSSDLVIISSLMHQVENKDNVIREAYRILKTGGKLLTVEWNPDSAIGPEQKVRVSKQDLKALLEKYGFRPLEELPAGSFHYALLYSK